jgi:hypothetical protein
MATQIFGKISYTGVMPPGGKVCYYAADLGGPSTGHNYEFTKLIKTRPLLTAEDARFFSEHEKALGVNVTGFKKPGKKKVEPEEVESDE